MSGVERLADASNRNNEVVEEVYKVIVTTEENSSERSTMPAHLLCKYCVSDQPVSTQMLLLKRLAQVEQEDAASVAEEISKLADESAHSAETISAIVAELAKNSAMR